MSFWVGGGKGEREMGGVLEFGVGVRQVACGATLPLDTKQPVVVVGGCRPVGGVRSSKSLSCPSSTRPQHVPSDPTAGSCRPSLSPAPAARPYRPPTATSLHPPPTPAAHVPTAPPSAHPLVLAPALAMDKMPGLSCLSARPGASSANLAP